MSGGLTEFWWPFIVSLGCVALVAVAGTRLTQLGPWYYALRQPPWKPPDVWFGVIWSTIFLLIAVSLALAWPIADASARQWLVTVGVINAILNVLWSALFFTMRRPDLAQFEWVLFWFSIVALLLLVWEQSTLAGVLMLPYLIWVSIAGVLNRAVVKLNPELRA